MKKRNLIIMLLVLVLLIGGYIFAVNYTPAQKDDTPQGEVKESIVVFETQSDSVSKIVFENETPFTLLKSGDKWSIAGKDVSIEQSSASTIAFAASYILATDKLETAENMADFGLDKPQAAVTVYFREESKKFFLGSEIPTGGYYYLKIDGEDTVYIVSSYAADLFFKTPSSVRDLSVLALEVTDILGFEIVSPEETLKVDYASLGEGVENPYSTLSVWDISSPFVHDAENQKVVEKLVTPASSIVALSVEEDGLSSPAKYGFDTTVTIKTPDKNYILRTGEANGVSYVYSQDKNIVYSVDKNSIAFSKVKAMDIVQRLLTMPMITDIDSVSVETENVSAVLSREVKDENVTKYYIDGKFAAEDAFKSMYQSIVALSLDGVIKSAGTEKCIATIVYNLSDGSREVLKFYPYDDINVAVSKNSVMSFTMKKSKLTELEGYLKAFIKNPTEKVKQ